jgi:KUP system potassium uptake protein
MTEKQRNSGTTPLAQAIMAALGVVFGDLGTSPLYTLKTVLDLAGARPTPEVALGIASLLVWTLFIITSIKYVLFAMRINNDGEGGILALMSLLGGHKKRPLVIAAGLFGAALIYGDGVITPAISVLSAVEGLKIPFPGLAAYVVPISALILLALFAIQPLGTAGIGRLFGPVMALWFLVIGALGVIAIAKHPDVLVALSPYYAIRFLLDYAVGGFAMLGGIFLCVTGAEALYADMGHVGAPAIRWSWYVLVLPALVLNYIGQTALILAGESTEDNIFFRLCPEPYLPALIGLATLATIIASQAIITGAFSMTRQAIQLGWLPRLQITQTSSLGYGQIYVGTVNWLLMVLTLGVTLAFGSSDRLAAAYGIAVSLTMSFTSMLLFVAMREVWRWPLLACALVAGAFLTIDLAFVAANLVKVLDGGYLPLALGAMIYTIMTVWHRGVAAISQRLRKQAESWPKFTKRLISHNIPRVPGTAVFLTRTVTQASPILVWHIKHNRALHTHVMVVNILTEHVPHVADVERISFEKLDSGIWTAIARYGFMETPDVPALLRHAHGLGCQLDLSDVTYYVGHETVVHRDGDKAIPLWQEALFEALERNSAHVTDFFKLPPGHVVEIGRQVVI